MLEQISTVQVLVFERGSTDASREVALAGLCATSFQSTPVNCGVDWNFRRATQESSGDCLA
jgi:hypothetical protein